MLVAFLTFWPTTIVDKIVEHASIGGRVRVLEIQAVTGSRDCYLLALNSESESEINILMVTLKSSALGKYSLEVLGMFG